MAEDLRLRFPCRTQEALRSTIWEGFSPAFCSGQTGAGPCSRTSSCILIGCGLFAPEPICRSYYCVGRTSRGARLGQVDKLTEFSTLRSDAEREVQELAEIGFAGCECDFGPPLTGPCAPAFFVFLVFLLWPFGWATYALRTTIT